MCFARDGIDGQWSTFMLRIGSPPQIVKLLPSITGQSVWTVLSQACQVPSQDDCKSARGEVFSTNLSSTWEEQGNFELPLSPQRHLPLDGPAKVGFDDVLFTWHGGGSTVLEQQVVNGYATEDIFIGTMGLSALPVNLTTSEAPHRSIVSSLQDQNLIPSTAYGYTAGAYHLGGSGNAWGSLTLGGYDSSRMNADANLTIIGGSDTYRPFVLGLEGITSQETDLLEEPIVVGLDSLITQVWLPESTCERFEAEFGLEFDAALELYFINESQHESLLAEDRTVTFTLSSALEGDNEKLEIQFPYAAFSHPVQSPFAGLNQSTRYFPLKRATNSTQYTLGRVFLQHVYMISDPDRDAFSLFPAAFPEDFTEPQLVPINSPGLLDDPAEVPQDPNPNSSDGLSNSAIAGIVIGSTVPLLVVVALFFCLRGRRAPPGKVANLPLPRQSEGLEPVMDRKENRQENFGPLLAQNRRKHESIVEVQPEAPAPSETAYSPSVGSSSYASLPWLPLPAALEYIERKPLDRLQELP